MYLYVCLYVHLYYFLYSLLWCCSENCTKSYNYKSRIISINILNDADQDNLFAVIRNLLRISPTILIMVLVCQCLPFPINCFEKMHSDYVSQ